MYWRLSAEDDVKTSVRGCMKNELYTAAHKHNVSIIENTHNDNKDIIDIAPFCFFVTLRIISLLL